MLYLLLAILSSVLVSVIMRLSTGRTGSGKGMLAFNYLTCLIVAAVNTQGNLFPGGDGFLSAFGMGAINGALYLSAFLLFRINVKRNGVVLSSSFMKLGLLVPMAVSMVAFGEMPGAFEIAGFVLALAAIWLISYEKGGGEAGGFRYGLVLLLLAGGGADAMSKVYEEVGKSELSGQFLFYTFLFAFLFCVCMLVYEKTRPALVDAAFGVMIGIPNYYSSLFLLKSLSALKGVIAYPTYSVSTILIVTLVGVCVFHERLRKKQWIGLGIVVVSLVLLNSF